MMTRNWIYVDKPRIEQLTLSGMFCIGNGVPFMRSFNLIHVMVKSLELFFYFLFLFLVFLLFGSL